MAILMKSPGEIGRDAAARPAMEVHEAIMLNGLERAEEIEVFRSVLPRVPGASQDGFR